MENEGEKVLYYLTEAEIQQRAEDLLDRELTQKELEEVHDKMFENFWHIDEMINDSIEEVIAFNDLVERNEGAETKPDHYLVYWKNENEYQKDYKEVFAALTEEDAREYTKSYFMDEFVHFKLTKVERNTETEIAVIRNEHFHSAPQNEAF